ncbi:MAG: DUF1732 domain-containing protein [Nannocystaceae bacterium]
MPIHSMTGFGAASRPRSDAAGVTTLAVELRSVNLRFLEIKIRQPFGVAWEERLRRRVKERVGRGRVELFVHLQRADAEAGLGLERERLHELLAELRVVTETAAKESVELSTPTSLEVLEFLRASRAGFSPRDPLVEAPDADALEGCVDEAVEALVAMRAREGAVLEAALRELVAALVTQVGALREHLDGEAERLHASLAERVSGLCARAGVEPPPPERLVQELAVLVQKGDITEELARIDSHVGQLRRVLDGEARSGQGKTLDFLCQELFREITTIGSKITSHAGCAVVIAAKSTVERMREQVQNVE